MDNRAIAIDPAWSRDKDDAIDIEFLGRDGWLVTVYVPDVASVLKDNPEKEKEACEQGVTLYDSRSIKRPMLGEELTQRLTLSSFRPSRMIKISMSVSPLLDVKVIDIKPVQGSIYAEISYEMADQAINDVKHPLHKKINQLWALGSLLQKKRSQVTNIVFDQDAGLYTNEEGNVISLGQGMAYRSTVIVMELMIMTNAALAKYAIDNGHPILFRNHTLHDMERGDRKSSARIIAEEREISLADAHAMIRSMGHELQPAVIEATPRGHHGLDLEAYGWFTSPLRRFCDVINLSSITYQRIWPDLEGIAARLKRIHNTARDSSSEHHGRMNRRRLVSMVASGRHAEAMEYNLHTLLNAMEENGIKADPRFEGHVRQKMEQDKLSTRDMTDLVDKSPSLFGDNFHKEVVSWIESSEARQIVLRGMNGDMVLEKNYKGMLLERAAKEKTEVTFKLQNQSGPSHEPVFTSLATWKSGSVQITEIGIGKTLKDAEKKAAFQILEKLGPPAEQDKKVAVQFSTENSKGTLLERAAKNKDRVEFCKAIQTGPAHKPSFEVEVIYHSPSTKNSATGYGSTKKSAEADACQKILKQMPDY